MLHLTRPFPFSKFLLYEELLGTKCTGGQYGATDRVDSRLGLEEVQAEWWKAHMCGLEGARDEMTEEIV